MMSNFSLTVEKYRYDCSDSTMTVYKKGFLNTNSERVFLNCNISDIEILFYDFSKSPSLYFVTPSMEQSHLCYATKDDEHNIEHLYHYLVEHGATERLVNRLTATFTKHSATIALEKQKKKDARADRALALAKKIEIQRKRAGCKEVTEEKYTCIKCNNIWYISTTEQIMGLANLFHGSVYSLNQIKQFNKCPKCGSTACSHKPVKFWVDKKGNAVDYEE